MRRVGLVVRGNDGLDEAVERVRAIAGEAGAEVTDDDPELVVVLGGDGTMLRGFHENLGRGVPVIGVNFGRFGFLASMQPEEMERGLRRVFAGDYAVIELATLEFEYSGGSGVAVNDAVVASSELGRLVELDWAIGGEELGTVPCDGIILATPSCSSGASRRRPGRAAQRAAVPSASAAPRS